MEAVRLSAEARDAVSAAVKAATDKPAMTHAEEVKALMAKGMKICVARGHAVWAFAPRKIAQALNVPYIAAIPAADDLQEYMAIGGEIVMVP
jgi:hypothetical protein